MAHTELNGGSPDRTITVLNRGSACHVNAERVRNHAHEHSGTLQAFKMYSEHGGNIVKRRIKSRRDNITAAFEAGSTRGESFNHLDSKPLSN